jgi:hypothetical protein
MTRIRLKAMLPTHGACCNIDVAMYLLFVPIVMVWVVLLPDLHQT